MDDQERYARFLSALGFRAGVEEAPGGSAVDLLDLDGEVMAPPVRLHVDERTLGEFLRANEDHYASAFPDDEPAVAGLRALLVQVEEAVLGREPGDELVLADGGVRAVRGGA